MNNMKASCIVYLLINNFNISKKNFFRLRYLHTHNVHNKLNWRQRFHAFIFCQFRIANLTI